MVTFRAVSPVAPEAVAILSEYFTMRAETFPGHAYSPVFPGADAFRDPDGVLLLAVDDHDGESEIAGCGAIRRLPDGDAGVRFEVKHLFVRPFTRGRGTGRALLEELERRARVFGATELVLDTHHTLEAAGALYARNGFTSVEPYNDNPNATVWLHKELTTS